MKTKKTPNTSTPNTIIEKDNRLLLPTTLNSLLTLRKTPPTKTYTKKLKTKGTLGASILKLLKRKARYQKASQCNLINSTIRLSRVPSVTSGRKYQRKTPKKITPSLVIPPKRSYFKSRRNIFKNTLKQSISSEFNQKTSKKILRHPNISTPCQTKLQLSNFTENGKSMSIVPTAKLSQKCLKKNKKITPELPLTFIGPRKSNIKHTAFPKFLSANTNITSTENLTHSNVPKPAPKLHFMRNKFGKAANAEPLNDKSLKDDQPQISHRNLTVKSTPSRTLELKIDAQNMKMLERLEKVQISKPVSQNNKMVEHKNNIIKNIVMPTLAPSRSLELKIDSRNKKMLKRLEKVQISKPISKMTSHKNKILKNIALQTFTIPKGKQISNKKLLKNKKSQTNIITVSNNVVSVFQPETRITKKICARTASAPLVQPFRLKARAHMKAMLQRLHEVRLPLSEVHTTPKTSAMRFDSHKDTHYRNLKAKSIGTILHKNGISPKKGKILTGKYSNKTSILLTKGIYSDKINVVNRLPIEGKLPERKHNMLKQLFMSRKQTIFKKKLPVKFDDLSSLKVGTSSSLKDMRQKLTGTVADAKSNEINKTMPTNKSRKPQVQDCHKPAHETELKEIVTNTLATRGLTSAECKATLDELFRMPETRLTHEMFNIKSAISTLVPVKNLSLIEKEQVLRTETELGIPLEGKTISEKILLAKMNAESKAASEALAEEVKKIKAAGLLTPFTCETSKEKEKVIKELIRQGLPLLEAKTSAEKKLMSNVRADVCKLSAASDSSNERADIARSLIPFLNITPTDNLGHQDLQKKNATKQQ